MEFSTASNKKGHVTVTMFSVYGANVKWKNGFEEEFGNYWKIHLIHSRSSVNVTCTVHLHIIYISLMLSLLLFFIFFLRYLSDMWSNCLSLRANTALVYCIMMNCTALEILIYVNVNSLNSGWAFLEMISLFSKGDYTVNATIHDTDTGEQVACYNLEVSIETDCTGLLCIFG